MTLEDLMKRAAGEDTATGYRTADLVSQAYALGYVHADNGIPEQLEEEHDAWVAVGDVVR